MHVPRSLRPTLLLFLAAAGCSLFEKPTQPFDVSRLVMTEEDEREVILGHEERMKLIHERFPGVNRLDLVRVLIVPTERRGPCWSEPVPPGEMKVEVRYGMKGSWNDFEATSFPELREQGWHGVYRTPVGTGIERRGRFEDIDLTLETEFVCTCLAGPQGKAESIRRPARLRFRWQGKGHLPEVSGRSVKKDRTIGLPAGLVSGDLVTYEFPVREEYPIPQATACGGTMSLQLLVDPPVM